MKIALVWPLITSGESTDYYNVQAFGMAQAFAERGYEVSIFTANRAPKGSSNYKMILNRTLHNFRVTYLPIFNDSLSHPVMPDLISKLREFSPNCIQCAEILSPSTYMAFCMAKICKIPFCIYQGTYKWPDRLSRIIKFLKPSLIRPVLKSCSSVFTKSEQTKAFMIENGAKSNLTQTVHLGFDRSHFFPTSSSYLKDLYQLDGDRIILLCVGRLVSAKNQLTIIKSVEELINKFPNILLIIIGNGPLQNDLELYIEEKNLENNVKIVNTKIAQSNMNMIYSSAYIFLSPSKYEIFGMTVLESMACGIPVIGSPVGGMKDIIKHGENGILVNSENQSEISDAISGLIVNKELYNLISKNGIQTSREFSWDRVIERMIPFYEKLEKV